MMSIFTSFKNTFLPSAEVSAARRQKVFGTTSKTAAAAVILGGAAAAIAAPAVITAAGARTAAASIGRAAIANPGKAAIVGLVGAPLVAGTIFRDPTVITKTPVAVANFQGNVFDFANNPSLTTAKDIFTENPVVAGLTTALIAGTVAGGASGIASIANTVAIKENTSATQEAIETATDAASSIIPTNQTSATAALPVTPSVPSKPSAGSVGSNEPLTPQTQVIGREVQSNTIARARKKKKPSNVNNVRVNVINQQKTYIGARTYKRYVNN